MVYLHFWLTQGGVGDVSRLVVLDDVAAPRPMAGDVVAELRQLFPAATVDVPPSGTPIVGRPGDLVVVVFGAPALSPPDDVIYDQLDRLQALARTLGELGHVLLYRAWWREADVLPARALSARVRRLRVERAIIRALRALQANRWLLRPRYRGN
jgi:hypothetical protein